VGVEDGRGRPHGVPSEPSSLRSDEGEAAAAEEGRAGRATERAPLRNWRNVSVASARPQQCQQAAPDSRRCGKPRPRDAKNARVRDAEGLRPGGSGRVCGHRCLVHQSAWDTPTSSGMGRGPRRSEPPEHHRTRVFRLPGRAVTSTGSEQPALRVQAGKKSRSHQSLCPRTRKTRLARPCGSCTLWGCRRAAPFATRTR